MKLDPLRMAYSMSVAGRHLARLHIDLRPSHDRGSDMRDLAQQLRSLADTIDKEADQ